MMSLASSDISDKSLTQPQSQSQSSHHQSPDENNVGGSPTSGGAKNFSRTPTSWDAEDDILLMHLKDQQKLGWKEIASHFNNRTPNACQFRWRRLKSGNLKNPPKSAAALGSQIPARPLNDQKKPKKQPISSLKQETTSSFQGAYSPLSSATFTGYDNNISNALAGLNALSNSPSHISSPLPNYNISSQTNPSTPGLNSPRLNNGSTNGSGNHHNNDNNNNNNNSSTSTNNSNNNNNDIGGPGHLNHTTYDNSPKTEVLDPQTRNNAPGNNATGGYYTDISIDPTMNLPHNQPHPQTPSAITPRNSTSQASTNSVGVSTSTGLQHNNSIIQIVRDDRNSVSSLRASVSSLPSKSMNIPHHQSNSLAHLPILFGGAGGSISGPSRNSSISGSAGIQQTTVSSLRNGSIGSGSGYYSRSGSVVIPYNADKKEEDLLKVDRKKDNSNPSSVTRRVIKTKKNRSNTSKTSNPVLNIPWTMEEDELLINRRNRELSFAELSILLPQRTEGEIWSRIDYLEKLRNGHRATAVREHRRRRQSSIGLDDVDDFYDVDDVIGGIGSEEDDDEDEDEDVLVDVDDSIGSSRKRKKRRASSAVNPLTVTDSIRRRLR
ncbi:uncharacterized protein RJT21DRAFT_41822 [Scheffersomyces amazonensis]|uniref:uncharacterized protein n=1 Tax=Scheffersomyces amazonensis TaxID=1078765 RepID=UPI00315D320A